MAISSTTQVLSDINHLLSAHSALVSGVRATQRVHKDILRNLPSPPHDILQIPMIPSPSPSPPPSPSPSPSPSLRRTRQLDKERELARDPKARTDLPPEKRARLARYATYVPEEETLRNDYSQRYVDGGEWPQNWVLGAELDKRFEEYPKQQRLLHLKRAAVDSASLSPHYLPLTRLRTMNPAKFDVILIDPPFHSPSFSWETLSTFPIPQLAGDPSFVFMWVGSGASDGLERGREVLARWGYRRCEDVVWVKTNKECNKGPGTDPPTSSLLTRTKQHCLMGIRGTVRRSSDNWFVHCNIVLPPIRVLDTDVIIWEGDPEDPTRKPPEMYALIESFCLGARRLELFGRRRPGHQLRTGWVTVLLDDDGDITAVDRVDSASLVDQAEVDSRASSVAGDDEEEEVVLKTEEEIKAENELEASKAAELKRGMEGLEGAVLWQREKWEREVREACQVPPGGRVVVPTTTEIDALRPKSPVRGGAPNNNNSNNNFNTGTMAISMSGPGMGIGMPNRPISNPSNHFSGGGMTSSNNMANTYPMMGPPMRIGPGVMNPALMQSQMQMQMGMPNAAMMGAQGMGVGNAGIIPMPGMMLPQMNLGMMPQMMGGMGPIGAIPAMGMNNMGGFIGDGGFPQGGYQNAFGSQAGFGGPQMNGWGGPY